MGRTGGKYDPLRDYLAECDGPKLVLTFEEIEDILKFKLPETAWQNSSFWSNCYTLSRVHAVAWIEAGWRVRHGTDAVRSQEVEFYKVESVNKSINIRQIFNYLNCPFPCDENELKEAYLEMITQYHPDKVNTMGPEIKELAEKKTKEINAMYEKALSYIRGEIDV
jgi:DnaJ like chaperone protein